MLKKINHNGVASYKRTRLARTVVQATTPFHSKKHGNAISLKIKNVDAFSLKDKNGNPVSYIQKCKCAI